MLKWRGTPLDQLKDLQLEEAIEKALQILNAMYTEKQARRKRSDDEVRREADAEMQLKSLRETGRIHKRF